MMLRKAGLAASALVAMAPWMPAQAKGDFAVEVMSPGQTVERLLNVCVLPPATQEARAAQLAQCANLESFPPHCGDVDTQWGDGVRCDGDDQDDSLGLLGE